MSRSAAILESEWRKDAARFSASHETAIFQNILARHSDPSRRYHGLSHLTALFHLLATHAPQVQPGSAARLAVWWHDAVYDATRSDNEERSAELARENLSHLSAGAALVEDVVRLIHATKNHWNGPSTGEGDFFLDADIAILGAPPNIYDQYTIDVRQEYAWAPDPAYRAGRSAFLTAAIARERLFRTDAFESTYAAQARENMKRELASLSGAP